jgi:hypothetical protein
MLESKSIESLRTFNVLLSLLIKLVLVLLLVSCIGNSLNAQNLRLNKTVTNTTPAPGEPFNFILDIACQSTTSPCEDVFISDFIPGSLEFLNFSSPLPSGVSGANYDPLTNEAVINFNNDQIAAGASIQIEVQVRFPVGTFDGTMANNTANAFSSNGGDSSSSASASSMGGNSGGSGCEAIPVEVDGDYIVVSPGETTFSAEVGNTGSTPIDNWAYETVIQSNLEVYFVRTPEFPGVDHPGELFYQTASNPGVWVLWDSFNLNSRINRNTAGLGLAAGDKVTALRIELGTVPGTGEFNPFIYPDEFNRRFIYRARVPADLPLGSGIENCGTYIGSVGGTNCNETDCFNTTVTEGLDILTADKVMSDLNDVERTSYEIGEIVRIHLVFASPAPQTNDVVGAVLTDILPAGMSYIPDSWYIEFGEHNLDFQVPVLETGTLPNGRDFVRFVWDDSHGNEFTIEPTGAWDGFSVAFEARIDEGISQGFHTNEMYSNTTGSTHDDCEIADSQNYLNGYASSYCVDDYTFEVILPPGSAGLASSKEVKGSKNSGYNQYPDFGTTVPGGVNDYRLTLSNPNSNPVDEIIIIDIFPYIGDTEILNPSDPRFSEWRPNLLEPLPVPPGGRVYYTTELNPCRDEVAAPSDPIPFPTGCNNPNWTTTPPSDITSVTGFKLDLGNTSINQNEEFVYEWEMRAPVDAPTNGEIAWNSYAWIGSNARTGAPLLPAEPVKVGIESFPGSVPFHGDFVWHDIDGNGIQDAGEPGINGVTVTLYEDNGDGIANPSSDTPYNTTVSGNGGLYLFSDFPLGDYYVVFSNLPAGFNPTNTDVGSNDALDSDGLITPVMTFGSTTDDRTCDLGLFFGEPPSLIALECELIDVDNTGCQNNNATATINATGGTPPYRYNIGGGNQSNGQFNNLSGGNYNITVTDASGNQSFCSFFIDCAEICETNDVTELVASCFNFGGYRGAYADNDAIVGFRENLTNDPTTNSQDGVTHYATHGEVGTVYGVAIGRTDKKIYTSAYMKRHAGFGPGGTGAIYMVDLERNDSPVILADLNAIYGAGTAGINPHDFDESDTCPGGSNFNCWFNDVDAWNAVGRTSLGDLDISDDQRYLYVMNMEDRHVYQIDIQNPNVPQTRYPFPLDQLTDANVTLKPLNPQIDIRPFALKYRGHKLFVGAVDTEESRTACCFEGGSVVYVYSLDLNTGNWTLELEADVQKGFPSGSPTNIAKWYPEFQDDYRDGNKMILADIEFDGPDMILGLRDITGDLFGNEGGKPIPGDSQTVFYDNKVGDIVRFNYDIATGNYTIESNGTSGTVTSSGANSGYGWPADSSPRGSFYHGDFFSRIHPQTGLGGLWVNPLEGKTYSSVYNPLNVFSTGVKAFDNITGSTTEAYILIQNTNNPANFGKTNGLGDMEGLFGCEECCTNVYMNGYIRMNRNWAKDTNGN